MKKLFLSVLFIIAGHSALSQSNGVDVLNNASCDVYFQLLGGPSPGCSTTSVSDILVFAAGDTQLFPDPTSVPIPGLSATDYILGVIILDRDRCACGSPVMHEMIGDPCTNMPGAVGYVASDGNCNNCGALNATWTPNVPIANLDFN